MYYSNLRLFAAPSPSHVSVIFRITWIVGSISELNPSCSLHVRKCLNNDAYGISGYFPDGSFLCGHDHPP